MSLPNTIDGFIQAGRSWIDQYGIWVIFVGLAFETFMFTGFWAPGLVILIASGYLAGANELPLAGVVLAATSGAILGDVLSYGLGATVGDRVLRKKQKAVGDIRLLLERDRVFLLLGYHYSPFLRPIVPCIVGSSRFSFFKWLPLDALGVVIWACAFIGAGFFARGASHSGSNTAIVIIDLVGLALTFVVIWRVRRFIKSSLASGAPLVENVEGD